MRLDIDPKVDVVFKLVFGNEDNALLLVSLLNAVLGQPGSVTGVEIVLPHSDKESPQDKTVIGDIKARDQGNSSEHLPASLDVPDIRRAMEVLTVFTQEERERERYELRLKYEHDQISLAHEAKENEKHARAEGLKEGIEQGRKEGAVDRIHLAQRLLKQAMRPREELLALPLEELLRLADALEQQLFPATNGASGTPEPGGA